MLAPRLQTGTQSTAPLETLAGEVHDIEQARATWKSQLDIVSSVDPNRDLVREALLSGAEFFRQLASSQKVCNKMFEADPDRSDALGQLALHCYITALAGLNKKDISATELVDMATRSGKLPDKLSVMSELETLFRVLPKSLEIDRELYAQHAPQPLSSEYNQVTEELRTLDRALQGELSESEYRKIAGEQTAVILREEELFQQIKVDPFMIPELRAEAAISFLTSREAVQAVARCIQSFDNIHAENKEFTLDLPAPSADGTWSVSSIKITEDVLQDPRCVSAALKFYSEAREMVELGERVRMTTHGLPADEAQLYKGALRYRSGKFFPLYVAEYVPEASLDQTARALLLRGFKDGARGLEPCRPVEDISKSLAGIVTLIKFGVENIENAAERSILFEGLKEIPGFNGATAEFLRKVFDRLQQHRGGDTQAIAELANLFNESIEKWGEIKRAEGLSAVIIATLDVLAQDPNLARKLRKQITIFDELREVLKDSPPVYQRYLNDIQKKLSTGMAGYFGNHEVVERARKVVHEFLLVNKRRDLIEGRAANEVIKNGILFHGVPGGGKTFLAKSLIDEFGIPVFDLSLEECIKAAKKKHGDNTQMSEEELYASGLNIIVQEAIEVSRKQPCCLRIDELDELAADRLNTSIPEKQRERTFGFLRLIDEIRQNHVGILLVATTNHIDRVDEAMKRDGRFDVGIKVPPPSDEDLGEIINGVLEDLREPVRFTDGELQSLVEISNSLMPLSVKQAIFRAEVIHLSEGQTSPLTFDIIKSALEEKVKDRQIQ